MTQATATAVVHDLIGVGFGPSNIALAIALQERAQAQGALEVLFLDKQGDYRWHGNTLVSQSELQISFLKDLVSLRNPTSPYSFVNYLHKHDRLVDFINLGTFYPCRMEFNDYLRWVASHFQEQSRYGEEVLRIEPMLSAGQVEALRVISRNADGEELVRTTRALVVSPGGTPRIRLGHSTLLLKLAGSWWLTDPVFSERASPLPFAGPKRFHAPPVALADLPPIRGIILSHDHYDHLDRAAIKALVPLVELFLAPLGVGDRLLAWGVPPGKVRQLDWWQGIEAGGLRLTATPAQHFSGRGLHDGNRTLWCSWVIESAELKLFFSGDSGYFDGFAEIGRRYGPFDLTMLETGAYNEHWPYVHMHPQQTLQAHRDLGGRWLLPIHNGTFDLAMHAWYEPFERILELATEHGVRVSTPMMGERIDLQAPHAGRRWWREVVDSETQVQGYGCCRS
ncbi:SidA/IucD/PvdA family monooxygenase [Pseudomonas aeruginosa]